MDGSDIQRERLDVRQDRGDQADRPDFGALRQSQCRVPSEVRLRDRVDVSDFGTWQAMGSEGPSLPIEPCDGSLKLSKTFSGCMLDYFFGQ